MKRLFATGSLFLALLLSSPKAGAFDMDSGLGLGWAARFDTGEALADTILGLRMASWTDIQWALGPSLYLGPELGLSFISWTVADNSTVLFSDWPLLLKTGWQRGFLRAEALAGTLFTFDSGTRTVFGFNLLAGLRASLGPLYIEGNLIWKILEPAFDDRAFYPRLFAGYRRSILDGGL